MKNLLISQPIIYLIAPPLKRFLMFFCLATKICIMMDPTVSHFEIFACALLDQSTVIVKAHPL